MRKKYEQLLVEFEMFQVSDVMTASAPIGDNNDGTIGDIYDLL